MVSAVSSKTVCTDVVGTISGLTVVTYTVSAVSGQAVGTDVVGTISGLTVVAYTVSAVSGQAVGTDVVGTISGLTVVAYTVSAISGQAVGTDMVSTIRSLTIRTGVRSVGVRRTTFGDNSTVQYRVMIRNRQSECTRCQNGKTNAEQKI